MATPVLIDTDMGLDDAAGLCLALSTPALDLRAVVGVGGNVDLDQVMANIDRVLTAIGPARMPDIGRGLDQGRLTADRRSQHGHDGLGDSVLPCSTRGVEKPFLDVYKKAIESAGGELVVLAFGPLTNLAVVLAEPRLAKGITRICLSGGAVWTRGNVTDKAEFNFHADPLAAAKVLSSGMSISVCPLDVTRLVSLDESHIAHLAASEGRVGPLLADILKFALSSDEEPGVGRVQIHDAVTTGAVIWPSMFLKTRMRLEIVTTGAEAGQSLPKLGGEPAQRIDLLTAVNAVDLLENLLESLCHETFVV